MSTHKLMKLSALAGSLAVGCLFLSTSALAKNSDYCKLPSPPAVTDSQSDFDEYAWKTFVSLNWPVSKSTRGKPDCRKNLGNGTPSWQTYKLSDEVFLPNAEDPGEWNAGYKAGTTSTIGQIAKASNNVKIDSVQEAVGGWLIDQQGNPTYFQMWVNETWYDYVVGNDLYNSDNFSNSSKVDMPDNAIEIKSAWKILTKKDDKSRYVTQESKVAKFDTTGQPTGKYKKVTLGLVGMHAIVKAPGFPQWIWATFEHVDNVPNSAAVEKTGPNGNYWTTEPQIDKNVAYSYFSKDAKTQNTSPCNDGDASDCIPFETPNSLWRITPIRDSAAGQNSTFQTSAPVKGTVFENYQLITTQWPTKPNNPGATNGDPTPTISANTMMESYIQSSSNCTNCHGTAVLPGTQVRSDFSFLFNAAQSAGSKK